MLVRDGRLIVFSVKPTEPKKAKFSLVLGDIGSMTLDECVSEMNELKGEMLKIDSLTEKGVAEYPFVRELIQARFKRLNDRQCYLLSKKR